MTEYLARISARKPLLTIALWVLVALVGGALSARFLDSGTTTELRLSSSAESEQAALRLEDRLRGPRPIIETVLVRSDSLTVDDDAFREKVESIFAEIIALGEDQVSQGQHYYQQNNRLLVSEDQRTTIIPLQMAGDLKQAEGNVEHILEIVEEADGAAEFDVFIVGNASISVENAELARHDLEQGERVGIPVALLILVALFGAIVAALLPVGLAFICILAALGLAALIGQAFQLVFFVTLFITMIGLAVGIDYSLIIVSRFRDEMARGLDKHAANRESRRNGGANGAVQRHDRSDRAVRHVPCAVPVLQSLAIGAILVVVIAMVATLTLLPAMLALLGNRINLLSVPFFGEGQAAD